jgi:SAM-dependent methyltransferase
MDNEMSQDWDAAGYAENARFVAELGEAVIEWLDPRDDERILDLGCGDGALTEKLGAFVVGIDASAEMVEAAMKRGLDARQMRAQEMSFAAEFDAVFTNAVLHWIRPIQPVLGRVYRALRRGGRFVGEFGGHGNVAALRVALQACGQWNEPWYYPTAEEFQEELEAFGFRVERIELFSRPTPLPGDMEAWFETFTTVVPADVRARATELLRPILCDRAGRWTADYVRLRFAARK